MEAFMKKFGRIFLVAFAFVFTIPVQAETWPAKPIKMIIPYPPGGNVDTAARLVAPGLQKILGQPVLVENKPGAGGMISGEYVSKSAPDGYTFWFTANGPLLFSPLIFKKESYLWDKNFLPVSSVSITNIVLQVHPSLPVKTLKDLVNLAKKDPGKLIMASPGAGTTNHLLSEGFQGDTGASWTTIQYKGNAPATTDLIAGRAQFGFDQISVASQFIEQGKTRPIAVTSTERDPALPNVPTFVEEGYPQMVAATFTGVMAPVGTPKEVVTGMHNALARVLKDKEVMQRFSGIGAHARSMTPDEFSSYLRKEYDRWSAVIKKANISK
jgi:tripartite-type tricarboxylate transporter receptor subunit TctC